MGVQQIADGERPSAQCSRSTSNWILTVVIVVWYCTTSVNPLNLLAELALSKMKSLPIDVPVLFFVMLYVLATGSGPAESSSEPRFRLNESSVISSKRGGPGLISWPSWDWLQPYHPRQMFLDVDGKGSRGSQQVQFTESWVQGNTVSMDQPLLPAHLSDDVGEVHELLAQKSLPGSLLKSAFTKESSYDNQSNSGRDVEVNERAEPYQERDNYKRNEAKCCSIVGAAKTVDATPRNFELVSDEAALNPSSHDKLCVLQKGSSRDGKHSSLDRANLNKFFLFNF